MTTNNLPSSTIISMFLSDNEETKLRVQLLVEEFLVSKNWMIHSFKGLTLPELSICSFGSKYPDNYQRTRRFVQKISLDLKASNKTMVDAGLAWIYNEGEELKNEATKTGRSYRPGGVYQFTPKMLGLLLLAKNNDFRDFVRSGYDEGGNKFCLPNSVKNKKMRKYVIAHTD